MAKNENLAEEKNRLYKVAFVLAIITIVYNILEGIISAYIGSKDESLALFGFGIDSFIEAISGFGIAHMVVRIKRRPKSKRDDFERTALKITGFSFYILAVGLLATSGYNVLMHHKPETTFWGVIISAVSIAVMWVLVMAKTKTGQQLKSDAIIADADCSKACIYMSVILLASSGIYELFQITCIDSIGAVGIAYFAFTEGKECFDKAKSNHYSCDTEE
nr:cation transporter [uncultured Flavobacterium sp.]